MIGFGRRGLLGGTTALLAAPAILHAQPAGGVKIGLVAVQTGPQAALGTQLRDGFLQGLRHLEGRLGGLTAEVVHIDDELRPEVAVTKVRAALERDRVDFVVGGAESDEFRRQTRDFAAAWGGSAQEIPGADHFTGVAPFADPDHPLVARAAAMADRLARP